MSAGSNGIAGDQLRALVERIEHVDLEIRDLNEGKKEIYAEARGNGFDAKIVKKVVALRRMDRDKRREESEILELYLHALGEDL